MALLLLALVVAIWSVINVQDTYLTWVLEEAFIGTQGYIWDTQSDMFCCLLGSVCALVVMFIVVKRGRA